MPGEVEVPGEIKPAGSWSREFRLTVILAVMLGFFGIAITIIASLPGIMYSTEVSTRFSEALHPYLPYLRFTGSAFLVCFFGLALWWYRLSGTEKELREVKAQSKQLSKELHAAQEARDGAISKADSLSKQLTVYRPYAKYTKRGRWETITEIKYGHLPYAPFLKYTGVNADLPSGPGLVWLERVLDKDLVEVKRMGRPRTWDTILDGLIDETYDVVAAPLFATFERSKLVAFTAPLFFSNVGFYVSEKVASHHVWTDLTIGHMPRAIEQAGKLRVFSVKGEISEKLASKYCAPDSIDRDTDDTLDGLISKIAESNDTDYGLFCESFHAETHLQVVRKKVKNVLPPYQILYPVCFAVRLGDYQLINLLNIGLLKFLNGEKGEAISSLTSQLKQNEETDYKSLKEAEMKIEDIIAKSFVTERPRRHVRNVSDIGRERYGTHGY